MMDAFVRTSRNSHADPITAAKASAAFVVFLLSFFCGLLPLKLADRWPLTAEYATRISRKPTVASLMLCFGAGVLLFTSLVHLQPDVRQSVRGLQAAGRLPDTDHFGDLIFCIGFFAAFAIYETANRKVRGRGRRTADIAVQPPAGSFHCGLFVAVLTLSSHDTFLGFAAGMRPPGPGGVWRAFAALAANKLVVAYCLGQELAWSGVRKTVVIACSALFAVVTPVGVAAGMALSQCCFPATADRSPDIVEVSSQGLAAGSLAFVVFFDVLPRQKLSGMTHMLSTVVGFSVMQLLQIVTTDSLKKGHSLIL
ncbi:zinc transporter ZIP1-like [Aphis craccivora]|uniref:Zinc transporter ZIP1-like n=1 Tax=Aphis craccivora TaxID=307492 RepID=A0A6G0Y6E7_APHCR|nr:zinc transporter ZIP1-like [Aphis craccivora]